MNIQIKETGKIEKLIIRDENGINWAADLVNGRNIIDYNEDRIAIMTQDDFDWWTNYINDYEQTTEDTQKLIDELIEADLPCPLDHVDCPDKDYCWSQYVKERLMDAQSGLDMENERNAAISEMEDIRNEYLRRNVLRKSTVNLPEYQWNWLEQEAIRVTYNRKEKTSAAQILRELIDKAMTSQK